MEMEGKGFVPLKNDGREMYFVLRELCFKQMNNELQKMAQNIETMAVTLDKVTTY